MDESLLAKLIEQAPLGIIVMATDLSVRYMNRAARLLHNIPAAESVDTLLFDEIVADPDSVRDPLGMVINDNVEPLVMPYEVGSAPPRRFISAAVGQVVTGSDGTWIILVAEDVTARKQFESELVETEKSSILGQLVVTLQHEINNQLQVIIGQVDTALDQSDVIARSNLAEIRQSAQRIGARLRHLASLDRVETVQYLDHVRMIDVDKDE